MRHELTRRMFIQQAACAGAVLASARAASAQSGMFLSLNGSMTRQMPWPDFVRLAGKVGYPGVDVHLGAARKDGVEATKRIRKRRRNACVLLLTGSNSRADVARARDAGAAAYITKDRIAAQLIEAIRELGPN